MNIIIQLLTAFLGSLGFAMLFNLRSNKLFIASLGGMVGWAIYLLCMRFEFGIFLSTFMAAVFCQLHSELLSRICKMPRTVFCIPAVVPLIPGSTLYYTMSYAVMNDWAMTLQYGYKTLQFALGIAVGQSFVAAASIIFTKYAKLLKKG